MFGAARLAEQTETKVQSCQLKMSDNAESPTETQKEELHSPSENSATSEDKKKIDVLLKAVGDAPIMKTKKWTVDRGRTVQSLAQFISRFLKLDANEQLFIYVHQSFAPSPDQEVGVLFDCFGSDGKLVLHYCKSQAWG
ncbi:ubiquitin-like protein ATG12 [Poeciliopsis prolifica]|uniref:ubiquitin-like protein ATG12 n=1 Tax=Poeciliopsis prolifica TaxID=188132 RepID=UPI002413236B|nr:ubiquitin-like protein ATG12 [Poeciliopsis prolifica]